MQIRLICNRSRTEAKARFPLKLTTEYGDQRQEGASSQKVKVSWRWARIRSSVQFSGFVLCCCQLYFSFRSTIAKG